MYVVILYVHVAWLLEVLVQLFLQVHDQLRDVDAAGCVLVPGTNAGCPSTVGSSTVLRHPAC